QAQPALDKAAPEQATPVVAEAQTAIPPLPQDGDVRAEILEFFVPEAEEHLQVVTDCLLSLETNPSPDEIHRLLRAMHTVKGSAAQVGLQRIARVAHRAEDLMGRVRDGALRPSAEIVDLCLEAVDALKKFLYRQWSDEDSMQSTVRTLFARIARLVPEEQHVEVREALPEAQSPVAEPSSEPLVTRGVVHKGDDGRDLAAPEAHAEEQILDIDVPAAFPAFSMVAASAAKEPPQKAEAARDADLRKEPAA